MRYRRSAGWMLAVTTLAAAGMFGAAGHAIALPPPGSSPPASQDQDTGDASPAPPEDPTPAGPALPRSGGGVHDVPPDPWGDAGGTNAPPDPFPGAPTPTLHRIAAALGMQIRSVTTVVTVFAGIAVDGGRPLEISISFGGARVTQNYDRVHGNQLKHDFPANGGARRTEPVDITLRETLPDGQFQPFGIRWTAPIEPLYDIKLSALYFHEIGHCDSASPADPVIKWKDPAGVVHQAELDPGLFDDFDILDSFAGTSAASGVSRGLTEPGILWRDDDDTVHGFHGLGDPARGTPLLPGATHKIQKILPADSGGPCSGEFTYFVNYTLLANQL